MARQSVLTFIDKPFATTIDTAFASSNDQAYSCLIYSGLPYSEQTHRVKAGRVIFRKKERPLASASGQVNRKWMLDGLGVFRNRSVSPVRTPVRTLIDSPPIGSGHPAAGRPDGP